MTQLAPQPPLTTPSRPPPGSLAFGVSPELTHVVTPVAHPSLPVAKGTAPRSQRWASVALLVALGTLVGTLGWAVFEERPQAIAHTSRPQDTSTETRQVDVPVVQRWMVPEVSLVIDESVLKMGPDASQSIMQAFGAWLSVSPGLPELRVDTGKGLKPKLDPDGVNAVIYAPIEFPGHEDDLAITIGFSDEETGEITEADIIINSRHSYARLAADTPGAPVASCDGSSQAKVCDYKYDLQNVMTHEAGHFYGLGEDRDDRKATMYSCTSACETHKRDPTPSDQVALAKLYTNSNQHQGAWGACNGASVAPRQAPSGMLAMLMLPLMWVMRRRRPS